MLSRVSRLLFIVVLVVAAFWSIAPKDARAASETLTVPFVLGTAGVQTNRAYAGRITITVSGTGQAAGSQTSDAFYIFTDSAGQPVTPFHLIEFGLEVNGDPVDNYVSSIPAYSERHTYSFSILVQGGRLSFGFAVGDTFTSDNTGAFTVTIANGNGRQRGHD